MYNLIYTPTPQLETKQLYNMHTSQETYLFQHQIQHQLGVGDSESQFVV